MFSYWNTSYGWGVDKDNGLNGKYYFTYYTTLGPLDVTSTTFEVILYILILFTSVVANVTIIIIVLRRKEIQTVTNCFIVNLAVADLIFAMGIPSLIVSRMNPFWCLGEAVCKLLPYSQFVCGSVLLWTLALISVDRLKCLTTTPYYEGIKHNHAIIISVVTWVFNIIIHIPVAIFFKEQTIQQNSTIVVDSNQPQFAFARSLSQDIKVRTSNVTICTLTFPASTTNFALMFTLPTTIVSCIVPMFVLVVNYHKIFNELMNIRKKLEEKAGFSDTSGVRLRDSVLTIASNLISSMNSTRSETRPQIRKVPSSACLQRLVKHKKSVRFLYCNVITVLLMWLPMPIVIFLIYFDGQRWDKNYFLSTCDFRSCVFLALLNTVVNPIFYGFLTENFRKNIRQWFRSKRNHTTVDTLAEHANMNNSSSRNDKITS